MHSLHGQRLLCERGPGLFSILQKGVPEDVKVIGTTDDSGTTTTFKPDPEIFPDTTFSFFGFAKD